MSFINVFLKTLGFLLAITTFLIIISVASYFIPENASNFKFMKGNKESLNVIATIRLNGPIINTTNQSFMRIDSTNFIEPQEIKKNLISLEKLKPKVLIISISSPGGSVTATSSLEKIINDYKNKNNIDIYFYTEELLASGGYWVATSGDKIFANYGSVIGSIGVSGPSWYFFNKPKSISTGILGQEIQTENGIEIFNQNAGASKDLYNPFRKPTSKELDHLQNIVTGIYDDFINKVSKSRKIETNTLKNNIGALIYSAKQAKEIFLIDDVLNYDQLIEYIVKINDFENYKVLESKIKNSVLERYLTNYPAISRESICNNLKSNFVTVLPTFLNACNY